LASAKPLVGCRSREPSPDLVSTTAPFDVLAMGAKLAVDGSQGIGSGRRLTKDARQLQSLDGHGLLQSLLPQCFVLFSYDFAVFQGPSLRFPFKRSSVTIIM